MSSKYKITDLPTSPLRGDDKLIVNRQNVSHKIEASDLIYFLTQIELPIDRNCVDVNDCPDGFVCVDGKCERLPCGDNDFCPLGYTCINDYCYKLCSDGTCKDGYICVDYLDDGNSICVPYPFPCDSENGCPPGFECYEGFCLQICNSDPDGCPEGSSCITVDINTDNGIEQRDYCIPYPFPCGSVGDFPSNDGCPPGFYCYGGSCYPLCGVCEDGFECTDIGDGINICYPETPTEGLVNDGPFVIRTVPVDPSEDYTENIIFTANQFGRSVLTLQGFIQNPGQNPGGGDGGEIIINIDPEWWDPEINIILPDQPGSSPVRNGHLQFENTGGDQPSQNPGGLCSVFAANQDGHSQISLSDGFELFDYTASSGTPNSGNEVTGKLRIGADRTHLNFWKWEYTEDGSSRNTGDNDGKTSFKMSQNVDIVPNGTDCNLGRASTSGMSETSRWHRACIEDLDISNQVTGNLIPSTTNTFDIGSTSQRWKNVYTNDLNLSNENGSNDVDGTWGDYTIQEGENDLFIINRRSGKKYRFMLEEV